MQQIVSTSDKLTKKNIINRISDIPGGVSLTIADLVAGKIVEEATPLSVPSSGVRTVCKQAKILSGSTTTVINVDTDLHNFKVGDFLGTKSLGKAYAITIVADQGDGTTKITVGTAIDTPATGDFVYEMVEEAASNSSVLENVADVILKEAFQVPSVTQVIWIKDALLRADVVEDSIGSEYLSSLDVNEVKY